MHFSKGNTTSSDLSKTQPAKTGNIQELYPTVDFNSQFHLIGPKLRQHGVCVVENVIPDAECLEMMSNIVGSIEAVTGGAANRNLIARTWTEENLPPQIRYGLYQSLLNNLKTTWELRKDPRMYVIFKGVHEFLKAADAYQKKNPGASTYDDTAFLYPEVDSSSDSKSYAGGKPEIINHPILEDEQYSPEKIDDFVASIDGVNIQPNHVPPQNIDPTDWAHVDQTEYNNICKCVQGQVVLSDCSASFRCTPRSHLYFDQIMSDLAWVPESDRSNWCKFTRDAVAGIKKLLIEKEGAERGEALYQIPIKARKGSVILWLSTTIHSAIPVCQQSPTTPSDPLAGWRGVVYVCLRPRAEFSRRELAQLQGCLDRNEGTNHWATKVFDGRRAGFGRSSVCRVRSARILKMMERPELVYDVLGWRPEPGCYLISGSSSSSGGSPAEKKSPSSSDGGREKAGDHAAAQERGSACAAGGDKKKRWAKKAGA